jgi:hypothetical protein
MATSRMNSLCGVALILSGVSAALWPVTHPWGTFVGAEVARTGQWVVAHTFHFLAGVFGLLGLLGFMEREVNRAGTFERAGFVLAFFGTIMFAGSGIFTAFVWPVLARDAPALTEMHGPFFTPPHPLLLITTLAYSLGYILLGIALVRDRAMPMWGAAALIAGAFLLLIPPAPLGPLPWIVFPVSGVLFGCGVAALGLALQRDFAGARARTRFAA